MKNYTLFSALVPFRVSNEPPTPIIIQVQDNAIPFQMEYNPNGQVFHFLVPCDENGKPIEKIPGNIYETAWNELYKLFGERMEQENIDVMDSVLKGVKLELESEEEARKEVEQGS